jgi:AcrR family transcriptional regulator
MVPILARAARGYRVSVASSSGFDSLTVKHDLFEEALRRYEDSGQETILLHLGDHDPSGVSIHESMSEDFRAFCEDSETEEFIELRRVAITPEQIRSFDIATRPENVKPTDSRSRAFLERGLEPAAQLEALPPDTLARILREGVESALDMSALESSRLRERSERQEVQQKLDEVNEVLRDAFGLRDE